jgi:hypothetical protein
MEIQVNALLETSARPASPAIITRIDALLNSLGDLLADEGFIPVVRH